MFEIGLLGRACSVASLTIGGDAAVSSPTQHKATMHVTQTPNGKWIIWNSGRPYGPYDSKEEAESDMRGLERFEKYKDTPGYITSDKGTIQ